MTSPERWARLSELLDRVLELPAPRRAELLAGLTGADAELRGEVEAVLAASEREGYLSRPVVDVAAPLIAAAGGRGARPPVDRVGEIVGPFRIVAELGQGGMGEVWLAERVDADFDQRVALKLLRPGLDVAELDSRFRRERRILAGLDHPHIARFLDGGVASNGLPYIAMEAVAGEPITAYCDRHRLDTDDRVRLFLEICDAVAYAHRSLVVHRDLKPANVLVDASGRAKLLDFGIAKVLVAEEGQDETSLTRLDDRLLTPAYAAPEQLLGRPVTTATDVHALGVLLYELLTGVRPFEAPGRLELERAVVERSPPRPSTRAGANAGSAGAVASRPARELAGRLRGDLDAIVLKAMRKEPPERYASAESMASDLRAFLSGRPVAAREGEKAYRARKFLRRYRIAAAAVAAVALSLVGGLAAALWQARVARHEAERMGAVKRFLTETLVDMNPWDSGRSDYSSRDLLLRGMSRLEHWMPEEPLLRAELYETLNRALSRAGEDEEGARCAELALAEYRRVLPETDPRVLRMRYDRVALDYWSGRLGSLRESLPALLRDFERRLERASTPELRADFAEVLLLDLRLDQESGALADAERKALAARALVWADVAAGADQRSVWSYHVALVLIDRGRYDEAAEALAVATAEAADGGLGTRSPHWPMFAAQIARLLAESGEWERALELAELALRRLDAIFGPESGYHGWHGAYLAEVWLLTGDAPRARRFFALGLDDESADVPSTRQARAHHGLARVAAAGGELDEARRRAERARAVWRALAHESSPWVDQADVLLDELELAEDRPVAPDAARARADRLAAVGFHETPRAYLVAARAAAAAGDPAAAGGALVEAARWIAAQGRGAGPLANELRRVADRLGAPAPELSTAPRSSRLLESYESSREVLGRALDASDGVAVAGSAPGATPSPGGTD